MGVEDTLPVAPGMVATAAPPKRAALEGVVAVRDTAGEVMHRDRTPRTAALPLRRIPLKACATASSVGMLC